MQCEMPFASPADELKRHENDRVRGWNNMDKCQQTAGRETGIKYRGGGKTWSLWREKKNIGSTRSSRRADQH